MTPTLVTGFSFCIKMERAPNFAVVPCLVLLVSCLRKFFFSYHRAVEVFLLWLESSIFTFRPLIHLECVSDYV